MIGVISTVAGDRSTVGVGIERVEGVILTGFWLCLMNGRKNGDYRVIEGFIIPAVISLCDFKIHLWEGVG